MDRTPLVAHVFLHGFSMCLILAQTDKVYLILAFSLIIFLPLCLCILPGTAVDKPETLQSFLGPGERL